MDIDHDDQRDGGARDIVEQLAASPSKARKRTVAKPTKPTPAARLPRNGQEVIVPLRHRHDGWTPIRQRAFLRGLAETGSVKDACKRVGLSKTSAYRLRELSPDFAAMWDKALQIIAPILEQAAFERGVEGWEEPVFHGGKIIGYRRRYSDAALRMLMQRGDSGALAARAAAADPGDLIAAAHEAARLAGGSFELPSSTEELVAALDKKLIGLERREKHKAAKAAQEKAAADAAWRWWPRVVTA